jgi:hypothetical protein
MTYPAVTLETKCWQADWKLLLTTDRLERLAEHNAFPFAERVLMINNVDDYGKVVRHADRAVARMDFEVRRRQGSGGRGAALL